MTEQVAFEPERSLVLQPSLVMVKFVASVIEGAEQPVAAATPVFVRIKVCVAELDPTFTVPKSCVSGDQERLGSAPIVAVRLATEGIHLNSALPHPEKISDATTMKSRGASRFCRCVKTEKLNTYTLLLI